MQHISLGQCKAEHRAVQYQLKSCTVPIFVPFQLSNIPAFVPFRLYNIPALLYRPNVCNCTVPYAPRTVPAYAVRDPACTAEWSLSGVWQVSTFFLSLYISFKTLNKAILIDQWLRADLLWCSIYMNRTILIIYLYKQCGGSGALFTGPRSTDPVMINRMRILLM